MNNQVFSKLIMHPSFKKTIQDLKEVSFVNIKSENLKINIENIYNSNFKVIPVEEYKAYELDPKNGSKFIKDKKILAYDESTTKFTGLEGTSYFASHSLILLSDDYIPITFLALYFYTKSKLIASKSEYIKYSEDSDSDSKKDFIKDKINFLIKNTPNNSILLIDGPLIAGDHYVYVITALKKFEKKNIIPIFFVKNSFSNLVINSTDELKSKYNTDLHWAYKTLKKGSRTNFFKYTDLTNHNNSKIFCYIKSFNSSPQRIEIPVNVFLKNKNIINSIIDMIYYFVLVQGNKKNPQIRPIAIAEQFARKTLKLIDFKNILNNKGITLNINKSKFSW